MHSDTAVPDDDNAVSEGYINVFEALALPDADLLFFKSSLRHAIRRALEVRGLSQRDAATALGVSQPNLARALSDRARGVTLDMLFRLWIDLGGDVKLTLGGFPGKDARGAVAVDAPDLQPTSPAARAVPAKALASAPPTQARRRATAAKDKVRAAGA